MVRRIVPYGLLGLGLVACTRAADPGQHPQVAAITQQLETTNEQLAALDAKVEALEAQLRIAQSSPSSPPEAPPAPEGAGYPDASDPLGRPEPDHDHDHAQLFEGIRCQGLESPRITCTVERQSVDRMLDDPSVLARQTRLIPHHQDGRLRGFKFYGIRPASVLSRLGLHNGDRLDRVNGEDITSLDQAMRMFVSLRKKDRFELGMTRRDKPYTLRIDITPSPASPEGSTAPTRPQ